MATRRRITWFRVWLLGMILILLAPIGWIIWELNTFAERRFTEEAAQFLGNIEGSDPPLSLQRFTVGYPERDGRIVEASDAFLSDLEHSIVEKRNVQCCESTSQKSGVKLLLTIDGTHRSHSTFLLDDGRLYIGKESVDFLGPMPDVPPIDYSSNED